MIKIFKNNSNPLEEIDFNKVSIGEIFVNNEGTRLKKTSNLSFEIYQSSELQEGEYLDSLEPKLLTLFWKLTNYRENNINRSYLLQ